MSSARGAAKALQVEHFGLGSHHKIVFGENILAGRAAGGVKPKIGKYKYKIVIIIIKSRSSSVWVYLLLFMFTGAVSRVWHNKNTPEPRCQLVGTGEERAGDTRYPAVITSHISWDS